MGGLLEKAHHALRQIIELGRAFCGNHRSSFTFTKP
jgi:hypothetical protein